MNTPASASPHPILVVLTIGLLVPLGVLMPMLGLLRSRGRRTAGSRSEILRTQRRLASIDDSYRPSPCEVAAAAGTTVSEVHAALASTSAVPTPRRRRRKSIGRGPAGRPAPALGSTPAARPATLAAG